MTAAVKTVPATCVGCQTTFQRKVQRGRPQRWCETCKVLPHGERTRHLTVEDVEVRSAAGPVEGAEVHTDVEGPTTYAEKVEAHRAAVNAAVEEVYEWWKGPQGRVALIKAGRSAFEAQLVLADKVRACGRLTSWDVEGKRPIHDDDDWT